MSKTWTRQPNRQKALETTIPALCSILFALISGVFVAAAMTDSTLLDTQIQIHPLIMNPHPSYSIEIERRLAVFLASTLVGICFYKSLLHCVWSQMSYYDGSSTTPDVEPELSSDPDKLIEWDLIRKKWNERRIESAWRAILYFDMGVYLLPLSMISLLPPGLLALAFYVWMLSLYGFIQALRRAGIFRLLFDASR
jgi:hypothetical protein